MHQKYIHKIHQKRKEYINYSLPQYNLTNNLIQLFKIWLYKAYASKITDPIITIYLATIDHFNQPHQHLVSLKYIDKKITFYINPNNNKTIQIKYNPKVSICFLWHALNPQVIILDCILKLFQKISSKYFYTQPKHNKMNTWASLQSKKIVSKKTIKMILSKLQKKFKNIKNSSTKISR